LKAQPSRRKLGEFIWRSKKSLEVSI
jgi:hypothetical protein